MTSKEICTKVWNKVSQQAESQAVVPIYDKIWYNSSSKVWNQVLDQVASHITALVSKNINDER